MAPSVWIAVSTVTVLISLAQTASALMCYQCNSSQKYDCQEMFDYKANRLASTNCDLYEARYCIKAVGIWGGIAGTTRFCSAKNLGDQCQYIRYPDHDRLYQACVYTCSRDDCNHAPTHASWLTAPLLLLTAFALYILR